MIRISFPLLHYLVGVILVLDYAEHLIQGWQTHKMLLPLLTLHACCTFLSLRNIKSILVHVLLVHSLVPAGVPHSESHRSLDWGNESPLSNICCFTAVEELNLLLYNILPVISPSACNKPSSQYSSRFTICCNWTKFNMASKLLSLEQLSFISLSSTVP